MSIQSKAKLAQGYDPKPEPKRCASCGYFQSDLILPAWMVEANAKNRSAKPYTLEEYSVEKNRRCGLGGFAVKKTATCAKWIDLVRA